MIAKFEFGFAKRYPNGFTSALSPLASHQELPCGIELLVRTATN
jgi:hypothetical protein